MTEQEWLECDDISRMLKKVRFRSFKRKSRLFACACCRCAWHLFVDDSSKDAVETAERHADGLATDEALRTAAVSANQAYAGLFRVVGKMGSTIEWGAVYAADPNPFSSAKNSSWMVRTPRCYEVRKPRPKDVDEVRLVPCGVRKRTGVLRFVLGRWKVTTLPQVEATGAEKSIHASLIRDIFHNPFRPIPAIEPGWLIWNDSKITKIAKAIYDKRAFDRLPVLADALQEAGCDNEDILNHCRQPGVHVRGCWVVDLLLGKE